MRCGLVKKEILAIAGGQWYNGPQIEKAASVEYTERGENFSSLRKIQIVLFRFIVAVFCCRRDNTFCITAYSKCKRENAITMSSGIRQGVLQGVIFYRDRLLYQTRSFKWR